MKAAVVNTLSQPPRYEEFAEPLAGEGEAIVEMPAVGLHPIMKALASGQHYSGKGEVPFIAGVDGVGKLADGNIAS